LRIDAFTKRSRREKDDLSSCRCSAVKRGQTIISTAAITPPVASAAMRLSYVSNSIQTGVLCVRRKNVAEGVSRCAVSDSSVCSNSSYGAGSPC